MDRRAIIIGNWQSISHNGVAPTRIKSLVDKLSELYSLKGEYPFTSLCELNSGPDILINPSVSDITKIISDDIHPTAKDTLVLLHYVGNSKPEGVDDLFLILKTDEKTGRERGIYFSRLLTQLYDAGVQRLVVSIDSCHSGRAINVALNFKGDIFAMFATGDGYAFNADFTERLIMTLDRDPHKNDHRIDRAQKGITYIKAFEFTAAQLRGLGKIKSYNKQEPICVGLLGAEVLRNVEITPPRAYNTFASPRTIYGRAYGILFKLNNGPLSLEELRNVYRKSDLFLIRGGDEEERRFVDVATFDRYLNFLLASKLIVIPQGMVSLTEKGKKAADREFYNEVIIESIETNIMPDGVSISYLEDIVTDLLSDMILTSPRNIQERVQMKGVDLPLSDEVRFALRILPSTGRFMKGSAESIFPSDLG